MATANPQKVSPLKVDLARAALLLRNAAPEEWDNFKRTFDAYTTEVTVAVINADASEIMTAKGAAQMCLWLKRLYEECDRTVLPTAAQSPVR